MSKIIPHPTKELEDIINALPGHVYWEDKKGIILGCNKLQAEFAGFSSPKEMIGKTDFDLPCSKDAEKIKKVNEQVFNEGKTVYVQEDITLPNNQRVVFLSKKCPRYDENNHIIGLISISINVTELMDAMKGSNIHETYIRTIDTSHSAETPLAHDKTIKVLLVEDTEIPAQVATQLLETLNLEVIRATTGEEAVKLAKNKKFNFILMDIGLPGIDGMEATRQIRAFDTDIPIIGLTGHADSYRLNCKNVGMNDMFAKPMSIDNAKEIIFKYSKPKVAATNDIDVIDFEETIRLTGDSIQFALTVLEIGYDQLEETKKELTDAYESQDIERAKFILNRIKGTYSYCGVPRFYAAIVNLENYLKKENSLLSPAPLYQKLFEEMDFFAEEFKKIKHSLDSKNK